MGNLSIVIEDESNRINLWDFAHNPAAFLEDEKGTILRGDVIWDAYSVDSLPYYDPSNNFLLRKFEINGDIYHNWGSFTFRRDGDFAVGLGGDYFFRRTDSEWDSHELEYPNALLVFSKRVNPLTSLGASMRYVYYDFLFQRVESYYEGGLLEINQETIKGFRTEIGVTRHLSSWAILGAALGYERLQTTWDYQNSGGYAQDWYEPHLVYYADFFPSGENITHVGWLSWQAVTEIKPKIKLGMEAIVQAVYQDQNDEKEGRLRLRLRGVYDPWPQLRLGVSFSEGDFFAESGDPIYSYFSSICDSTFSRQLGAGFALRFGKLILAGVEYHYSDDPRPRYKAYPCNLKTHSVNLGVEGRLSEALFARGGYINSTIRPDSDDDLKGSWENAYTLGLGFEPLESHFIFELSYRYALKKYRDWYGDLDLDSGSHIFSVSVKKRL
jgi:opacity protein-like surface antigen